MIVYHGSNVIVNAPDTSHSFRPLDFGKGFYVTTEGIRLKDGQEGRRIYVVQIKESSMFIR